MKESFSLEYFKNLSESISRSQVTSKNKSKLSIEQAIDEVVKLVCALKAKNKKAILVGNGGSAAIASHQAIDFWRSAGIRATAFNDLASLTCIGNDFGYENVFAKPIQVFADAGDLVLAISSSGKSVNILNAVSAARQKKCHVITYSGFDPKNPLRQMGDFNFYVNSNSYGHVEVAHLALIHAMIDTAAVKTKGRLK